MSYKFHKIEYDYSPGCEQLPPCIMGDSSSDDDVEQQATQPEEQIDDSSARNPLNEAVLEPDSDAHMITGDSGFLSCKSGSFAATNKTGGWGRRAGLWPTETRTNTDAFSGSTPERAASAKQEPLRKIVSFANVGIEVTADSPEVARASSTKPDGPPGSSLQLASKPDGDVASRVELRSQSVPPAAAGKENSVMGSALKKYALDDSAFKRTAERRAGRTMDETDKTAGRNASGLSLPRFERFGPRTPFGAAAQSGSRRAVFGDASGAPAERQRHQSGITGILPLPNVAEETADAKPRPAVVAPQSPPPLAASRAAFGLSAHHDTLQLARLRQRTPVPPAQARVELPSGIFHSNVKRPRSPVLPDSLAKVSLGPKAALPLISIAGAALSPVAEAKVPSPALIARAASLGASLRPPAVETKSTQTDEPFPRSNDDAKTDEWSPLLRVFKDALRWFSVNNHVYWKMKLLGKGQSEVFEVLDVLNNNIYALKVIHPDISSNDNSFNFYMQEIELLRKLQQHSDNIIGLHEFECCLDENVIYVVMERADVDMQKFLRTRRDFNRRSAAALPDGAATGLSYGGISYLEIKYYFRQMVACVQTTHAAGIVHSDLKPGNFVLSKGQVKLIDFGIASKIQPDRTSVTRQNFMGSLNFTSPETLMITHSTNDSMDESGGGHPGSRVGYKSDVWSLGCILYLMVYGRTPFESILQLQHKIAAITSDAVAISFKSVPDHSLFDVLQKCLQRDPQSRIAISQLLVHPYVTS